MNTKNYPRKRPRIEATTKAKSYTSASDIRASLHTDNAEELVEVLTTLRNQLTVKTSELSISPQDERLNIVKQWMQVSHGANDLFSIWDTANPRQYSLIALLVSLLSSILTLLSAHYTDHALGQPIMKILISPSRLRQLNSYIGGSHNELIIVTLKLYNVMSNFASGKDRKTVLEGFGWEIKSLPKLLNMRRKTNGERDTADPLLRPDIRTLYILLLLSFVEPDSLTQTKITFLEQHREAFLAIFKGIVHDHYKLARKILEVCWAGIWLDPKIKRTLKVGLFNETTLTHLFKLYDRMQSDSDEDEEVPANLVHHFMLAICTRPGVGICFKDRGWYPRETDADDLVSKEEEDGRRRNAKIYNKILANILKTLKVNEDARQQELAFKILAACPELVAGYWSAAALTLEPRLSSKWITNIAVFGNIISLPVPTSSFYMPNAQLYQPTPPPLSTVIENILPSVGTKNNFSKGLQSPSSLVRHCTALALARCLVKYERVNEQFRKIAEALEENETEGQWFRRRRELEREVRRRVPDFQVIIGFSQQKHVGLQGQVNRTKVALLTESAQRLLWLYHHCLPAVVAEVRFDVGKLLQTFSQDVISGSKGEGEGEGELPDAAARIYRVQQLHVLSLLKDSNQFVWTSKIASLPRSALHTLLTALISAKIPAIRMAVMSLVQHLLSQSILFQEDPQEVDIWLNALPGPQATVAGADSMFQGEADGVVLFIDECVQTCLKGPSQYAIASETFAGGSNSERPDMSPSPLLSFIIEHLGSKIDENALPAYHILGITSFIRNLLIGLASKIKDLHPIWACIQKIEEILLIERLQSNSPTVFVAIEREIKMLHASLSPLSHSGPTLEDSIPALGTHLTVAEQSPIPESKALRAAAALQLIDQLRTSIRPLEHEELKRLLALITTLDSSIVPSIFEYLIPGQIDIWKTLELFSRSSQYSHMLSFEWLYMHTRSRQILDVRCRNVLHDAIFAHGHTLVYLTRTLHSIMHAVRAAQQQDVVLKGHLSLLARVLKTSSALLSLADLNSIKEVIFIQPGALKEIMMSPSSLGVIEGIELVLESIVKTSSAIDRKIVAPICSHWSNALKTGLDDQASVSISTACVWVKYLESEQLFDLLDFLEHESQSKYPSRVLDLINAILGALCATSTFDWQAEQTLALRLPRLLSLKSILFDSPLLEQVVAVAVDGLLPVGIDGCPVPSTSSSPRDLTTVVRWIEARWSQRHHPVKIELDIWPFLLQNVFSDATVKIISGLLYIQPSSRRILAEWLTSEHCSKRHAHHIVPVLHAFLDSSSSSNKELIPPVSNDVWPSFIPTIIRAIADENSAATLCTQARYCLLEILTASAPNSAKLLDAVAKEFKSLPAALVHRITPIAIGLANHFGSQASSALAVAIERGVQWCIDEFAEYSESPESKLATEELASLMSKASTSKAHLIETLLSVIIQSRFTSVAALRLAAASLTMTQLKPLVVNRYLQSIIQHPHFFKICGTISAENLELRDALIKLLHCLFNLHPHNTCQITHIEPLIKVYRGTLSSSDLCILSIFRLFESQRKLSTTAILSRWSATPNTTSQIALEALQSLDPIIVLRTCLDFPRWRRIEDQSSLQMDDQAATLYDPVFLMLLFSQMLAEQPPNSAFGWIELFRTNIVSLFIRALSSKDGQIRDLALCQIVGLWRSAETADLQEKPHVLYILNLLKDILPPPSVQDASEYPLQMPTYTTLLLMHSLRAVFHPSSFIYPITARFLLQRPTLDTTDLPMLFGLLYSSSDENWKKERGWMVRFLADGMVSSEDWRILKRRHTWDLLASLFQSADEVQDSVIRLGILEILANITCNAQATSSLILKSGLLVWIETQLLQTNTKTEGVEWIKILDNILVAVDSNKIEAATNGEWRFIICRCLASLLDDKTCATTHENFPHAVPVIMRLASFGGPKMKDLPRLLDLCVQALERLENDIQLDSSTFENRPTIIPTAPHRSLTLHQRLSVAQPSQQLLKTIVEMLWRACMTLDHKCAAWEKLTPRMLLWRSVNDKLTSATATTPDAMEWVRREVVRNLGESTS